MKYIVKISPDPDSLSLHKINANAVYDDSLDKSDIQTQLIKEQKGLCAYCMGRIKVDKNKTPTIII